MPTAILSVILNILQTYCAIIGPSIPVITITATVTDEILPICLETSIPIGVVIDLGTKEYIYIPTKACSNGPKYFEYFGHRLVELSDMQPGTKILDIAAGRGASLFPAAEKIGQSGFATGIDFSKEMVAETRKEIKNKGYKNIHMLQMDAEKLEVDSSSFDYVICGLSIQFFTKYTEALREMNRVLKPGGKLGISTWKKKDVPSLLLGIMSKYLKGVTVPHNLNKERGEFGTAESLINMLHDAGFSNIHIIEEQKTFYYRSEEEWWQEQWSHAGRAAFELIKKSGDEVYQQFKAEVSKKLHKNTNSKGIAFDANILYAFCNK